MSSPLESQSTEAPDGFTPLEDQKNQMNELESAFASSSSSEKNQMNEPESAFASSSSSEKNQMNKLESAFASSSSSEKNQMNEPESAFATSSSSDREFHRRSVDMPATKRIALVSDNNLNNLPDDMLYHILSFLPIKAAATTSLLSKRWRSLFAFAPTLSFSNDDGDDDQLAFMQFVNRVLVLRGEAILKKFSLDIAEDLEGDLVDGWIRWALEREVTELEIQVHDLDNWSGPSADIFLARELLRLEIGTGDDCIIDLEGGVHLPSLRLLLLDDVQFRDGSSGLLKLLSGCPVLETLSMVDMKWYDWDVCCVSSTSLKKLRFSWESYDGDEDRNGCPKSVSFNTPNLQYLEYTDDNASKYPTANFDKLAGAKIRLRRKAEQQDEDNVAGDATDFWKSFSNVEILFLTSDTLEVLTGCGDDIPVFKNLRQLTIKTGPVLEWESLPALLNNCPKLETLFFKVINDDAPPQKEEMRFECGGAVDTRTLIEQMKQFLEQCTHV